MLFAWQRAFYALLGLSLAFGLKQELEQQILNILYQQAYLANPLLGVGVPPQPITYLPGWRTTPNYTATAQLIIEELTVDDSLSSFDARYIWHLKYDDPRFYSLYWDDPTPPENCSILCCTSPNTVINQWGQDACCLNVYSPNSHFLNLKGTTLNSTPQEWYWYGSSMSSEVNYWFRGRSTFNANFDFQGFPFEEQQLQFIIYGDFIPELEANSFILNSTPAGLPIASLTEDWISADPHDFVINGWKVVSTHASAVSYNFHRAKGGDYGLRTLRATDDLPMPGMTFTIIVARKTTAFYIQLFIIPPALEMLLVFASYGLSVDTIRNRLEFLGILFLALLFVQFSVRAFLPAATLIPPYIVCVVSYGYVFAFAASYLLVEQIAEAHKTTSRRKRNLSGRLCFADFLHKELKLLAENSSEATEQGLPRKQQEAARLVSEARQKLEKLEASVKALDGPWYLRHQSRLMLWLLQKSAIVRWVDKRVYCLTRSTSQKYCHELAEKVELVSAVLLFVTFYLGLALIYALQKKLSFRVAPL